MTNEEAPLIDIKFQLDMYGSGQGSAEDTLARVREIVSSPSLTDDQQVVLDYLKSMCPPKLGVSAMVTVYCLVDDNINYNWQEYSGEIPKHIEALQKLSVAEENQVLQAFSQWALEKEETK